MAESIADAAVALSLMLEALKLLNGPDHAEAMTHLRKAIDELSPKSPQVPSPSRSVENPDEP